jgi:hypothetical protein
LRKINRYEFVLDVLTCKGTLWQVLICLRPRTPYPPYTLYMSIQVYLTTRGKEGGVEPERRERGNSSQS